MEYENYLNVFDWESRIKLGKNQEEIGHGSGMIQGNRISPDLAPIRENSGTARV